MSIARRLLRQLEQASRPLQKRIVNAIARGVVHLVDDATRLQVLQVAVLQVVADMQTTELVEDAERFQHYGFSSVPLPGAEAVLLFPNGDRGHPLVVAVDDRRHRPRNGEPGEVAIYTHEGDEIRLRKGHVVSIKTSGTIVAEAGAIKLGGEALTALQGVVQGEGIEPVTGMTFAALGAASAVVMARKT